MIDLNDPYYQLSRFADPIFKLNLFIEKWCGDNYPHLIDSDDNDGQEMRDMIAELQQRADSQPNVILRARLQNGDSVQYELDGNHKHDSQLVKYCLEKLSEMLDEKLTAPTGDKE